MTGKASNTKTTVDIIKKQKRDQKRAAGLSRQNLTGFSSGQASSSIRSPVTSGSSAGSNTGNFIRSSGDTMVGPLAFYFQSKYIASGTLDISEETGAYSSRVIVIGQGGAADDLEVILGASHAGQILFFQPIQAVTLQSYLKTAAAWASGTSYSIGDVVLYNSQRYTCYVAHTSSGSILPTDTTKWYRNNIRITGATEQVVAVDEIILLQYDSTDGVWTVVSGGGSGSSGAGLADANVWTNVNTFQSTVNFTGPTVNLGDSTNDRVNFISQVGTDINMGTYDIVNLDRLKFGTTSGSGSSLAATDTGIEAVFSGGNSYGMKSQVPANNIYQMFIGTSSKIEVGTGYITLNDNVVGGGSIQLSAMTAPSASGATQRKLYVDTADNHLKIRTNTSSIDLETSSGGGAGLGDANVWTNVNTFQNTVNFTGAAVNLGDSTNDRVNFIAQVGTDINMGTYDVIGLDRLKFSTTAGSGSALGTSDTGIEAQFSGGSSAGVKLQVPANNIYQFFIGSTEKFNIGTSISALNMDLALSGYLAIGDNYMEFGDMTSANVGTTPANKRRVFSDSANNDELSVKKSDGSVVSLEGSGSGGVSLSGNNTWTGIQTFSNQNTIIQNDLTVYDNVTIQDDLEVYDDVTLGSSISDDCIIKGRLDLTTNAVVGTVGYPSVALGFITVKIGGNLRNIYYS